MTVKQQRLMRFQKFIKRPPIKEAVVVARCGASLTRLDGDQTTEERQNVLEEFGEDLN